MNSIQYLAILYVVSALATAGYGSAVFFTRNWTHGRPLRYIRRLYELSDWYCKPTKLSFKDWYFSHLVLVSLIPVLNLAVFWGMLTYKPGRIYTAIEHGYLKKRLKMLNVRIPELH
jgi:hypothetical protein